jgi:hypothetical protein
VFSDCLTKAEVGLAQVRTNFDQQRGTGGENKVMGKRQVSRPVADAAGLVPSRLERLGWKPIEDLNHR